MEIVVIITMPSKTARDLNSRKRDGVQIRATSVRNFEARELNPGTPLHGQIDSRVFLISKVQEGDSFEVILGNMDNPEKVKPFTVPDNKEYITVDLG